MTRLPADIWSALTFPDRWQVRRVLLVDDGESITVRPVPDDPNAAVRGKYAWLDVTCDELRAESRIDATERDDPR